MIVLSLCMDMGRGLGERLGEGSGWETRGRGLGERLGGGVWVGD